MAREAQSERVGRMRGSERVNEWMAAARAYGGVVCRRRTEQTRVVVVKAGVRRRAAR